MIADVTFVSLGVGLACVLVAFNRKQDRELEGPARRRWRARQLFFPFCRRKEKYPR